METTALPAPLATWSARVLGADVDRVFFTHGSMSQVYGVDLTDGRRVALKTRRGSARVVACAQAHRAAAAASIDCPALLAGPEPLDTPGATTHEPTWVSAEQWRADGTDGPPPQPASAYTTLALRLHHALNVALDVALNDHRLGAVAPADFAPPPPWAHYDHGTPGRVFPPPASPRWDPESDVVPRVYRDLAATAAARLYRAHLPDVLGHCDLNGHNVKWVGDHAIVHDWDSIAARPEAVLAGILAVNHVELPGRGAITPPDGTAAVLDLYRAQRPLTPDEVEVAWAAGVWVAAYNASFEHLHGAPGQVAAQLLRDGTERLRRAGC